MSGTRQDAIRRSILPAILSLLVAFAWVRAFPEVEDESQYVVLTRIHPGHEIALPKRATRATPLLETGDGETQRLAYQMSVRRGGRHTISGISSALASWPVTLYVNDVPVAGNAFFHKTGSLDRDFEEHHIASGVRLEEGFNRVRLVGRKILLRTIVLRLQPEVASGVGRYAGIGILAFLLFSARQWIAHRLRPGPRVRLVAVPLGASALIAGSLAFVGWSAGEDLVSLGRGSEGRFGRIRDLEQEFETRVSRAERDRYDVLVLGDSTHAFPHAPDEQMIPTLRRMLPEDRRDEFAIHGAAAGAFDAREYYLLLNRFARQDPDLVVLPVNLRLFGPLQLHNEGNRFHQIERYLRASELLAARRVLGLSVSHQLLRWLDGGLFDGRAAEFLEGVRAFFQAERDRWLEAWTMRLEGDALPVTDELLGHERLPTWPDRIEEDHPLLGAFRLINRLAAREGIAVLYYTVNQNVEAQWREGHELRLTESYAAIERAIGHDPGVRFVHLAEENPPWMFHDALDHLTREGLDHVASRLAAELLASRDAEK